MERLEVQLQNWIKTMKFYLREEMIGRNTNRIFRTAHIVKDENNPRAGCLCNRPFNPDKWLVVDQLPEGTHLCKLCQQIARRDCTDAGPAEK